MLLAHQGAGLGAKGSADFDASLSADPEKVRAERNGAAHSANFSGDFSGGASAASLVPGSCRPRSARKVFGVLVMSKAIKIIDDKEEERQSRAFSAMVENARRTEPAVFVSPDFINTNGKRRREVISVYAQKIGDRIRLRRRELGWNQGKLAAELGVSQDSVSRYEAGITDLTASELPRIAEVLKVPVAYFFEPFSYSSAQAVTDMLYGPGRRSEILGEAELAELRQSVTTENETLRFF